LKGGGAHSLGKRTVLDVFVMKENDFEDGWAFLDGDIMRVRDGKPRKSGTWTNDMKRTKG
jgi:hypothetical protein